MKTYLLKYKMQNFIIFLLLISYSLINVTVAVLFTYSTNAIIKKDIKLFLMWDLVIIGLWILMLIIDYVESVMQEKVIQKMNMAIREDILKEIENNDIETFNQDSHHKYISWLTNDINLIREEGFLSFYELINLISQIVFACIALTFYNISLTIVTLVLTYFMIKIPSLFEKTVGQKTTRLSKINEQFVEKVNDTLGGFHLFYKANQLAKMRHLVKESTGDILAASVERTQAKEKAFAFIQGTSIFSQILIDILTGTLAIFGYVSFGSITTTGSLAGKIFYAIGNVSEVFVSIKSIEEIFNKFSVAKKENPGKEVLTSIEEIKLENISFSVNEEVILANFSLNISKGEKIVIVGRSGSGKSTLGKIIAGELTLTTGDYYINGKAYHDYSTASLNKKIAYVDQGPYIFNQTIENNLTLFSTFTKANEPIETTLLEDLNTRLEQQATGLSGGQRQRLNLARSLRFESELYILDESTSSLNKEWADKIERFLFLDKPSTTIFITHHLSNDIKELADKIIDLNELDT